MIRSLCMSERLAIFVLRYYFTISQCFNLYFYNHNFPYFIYFSTIYFSVFLVLMFATSNILNHFPSLISSFGSIAALNIMLATLTYFTFLDRFWHLNFLIDGGFSFYSCSVKLAFFPEAGVFLDSLLYFHQHVSCSNVSFPSVMIFYNLTWFSFCFVFYKFFYLLL